MDLRKEIAKHKDKIKELESKKQMTYINSRITNETKQRHNALVKRFNKVCPGSRDEFNELMFNYGMNVIEAGILQETEKILKRRSEEVKVY